MKWWWNMTEKARTIWSAIILLIIAIAFFIGIICLIKWLVPFIFNTAITVIGVIIVIAIFCFALNF